MKFDLITIDEIKARRDKSERPKGMKISLNISGIEDKKDKLEVGYIYISEYPEKVATIRLEGKVLVSGNKSELQSLLKNWKDKKPDEKFMSDLINIINYHASLNGVYVARSMNLPPPISPPKIKVKFKKP
ncbi:hypothetical protein KAW38_00570 [Candidatus Micrarchaeota archaeon]|nr:hypothetical protein [Candidatus Micrarchaeota archaeon]